VPPLGWWMAGALREYVGRLGPGPMSAPVLVPVPLHPAREKSRGYNQAALLALEVAERLDVDVETRILGRAKNTTSQTKLDPDERAANVRGAFRLLRADLANCRDIILVDDLVTTGASAGACIEAIEEASPASIAVLSAGRTRGSFPRDFKPKIGLIRAAARPYP
jgi:ComF family protein